MLRITEKPGHLIISDQYGNNYQYFHNKRGEEYQRFISSCMENIYKVHEEMKEAYEDEYHKKKEEV